MSLVAYGSSDDDSENEEISSVEVTFDQKSKREVTSVTQNVDQKLRLSTQENKCEVSILQNDSESLDNDDFLLKVNFSILPKPKSTELQEENIVEDGDIPPKKESELQIEKSVKKDRGPVKISIPSINDFKDLEDEDGKKPNKNKLAEKSSGLFSILPPPKHEKGITKPLIPQIISKTTLVSNITTSSQEKCTNAFSIKANSMRHIAVTEVSLNVSHYDSNSEDEDDTNISNADKSGIDFLGLNTDKLIDSKMLDTSSLQEKGNNLEVEEDYVPTRINSEIEVKKEYSQDANKTLVSNIMNLPKEEILLKNKAEVGPKLPIPEQEFNVDAEGNVAFDEKAIEYLCGKRGIKRKNQEVDETNIIEIKGDDIKPDERDWLVKALTEQPVHRPLSMHTSGVSSQSKKKHQITYLAHQAKAMEVELKNQWALNRMTRKQTQSKYGF